MLKLTLSALWLLMTAAIARIASTPISVETQLALAAAVLGAPVLLSLTKLDRHHRYVCRGLSLLLVVRCFAWRFMSTIPSAEQRAAHKDRAISGPARARGCAKSKRARGLASSRAGAYIKPPNGQGEARMTDIKTIPLTTIDGEAKTFGDFFAGGPVLVVNVASKCGFTPQYAGLEAIYRRYKERGFAVLGFPCDQFAHQEPGDEAEIKKFCSLTYDVTFPLFSKIDVNGSGAHPLFQALKSAAPGLLGTQAVKWNFTKFLVDKTAAHVKRYAPNDAPESLAKDIEAWL